MDKSLISEKINPDLLKANCHHTATEEIRIDYTEEQLNDLKSQFFVLHKTISLRENAISLFKEAMMTRSAAEAYAVIESLSLQEYGDIGIKSMKVDLKDMLKVISQGYDIAVVTLFAIPYYDIHRMAYYNDRGEFVHDRPFRSTEYQQIIQEPKMRSIGKGE